MSICRNFDPIRFWKNVDDVYNATICKYADSTLMKRKADWFVNQYAAAIATIEAAEIVADIRDYEVNHTAAVDNTKFVDLCNSLLFSDIECLAAVSAVNRPTFDSENNVEIITDKKAIAIVKRLVNEYRESVAAAADKFEFIAVSKTVKGWNSINKPVTLKTPFAVYVLTVIQQAKTKKEFFAAFDQSAKYPLSCKGTTYLYKSRLFVHKISSEKISKDQKERKEYDLVKLCANRLIIKNIGIIRYADKKNLEYREELLKVD